MAIMTIALNAEEIGQIIDGVTVRMEAYQRTAAYLEGVLEEEDDAFVAEDVRDADEAKAIAATYRCIIDKITSQMAIEPEGQTASA